MKTLFALDERGRIVSTLEPDARPGPLFILIRGASSCAWAMRADVDDALAAELDRLAAEEPPTTDFQAAPANADRYLSLLRGQVGFGPAFTFPETIVEPTDIVRIDDLQLLERNFRGWNAGEIPERSPILAIMGGGYPVSVCFCARITDIAAEAGLETAEAFRGRGYAPRVTAAWAVAIRASGRTPLYSTSWNNTASLAVARKLNLIPYASDWSIGEA